MAARRPTEDQGADDSNSDDSPSFRSPELSENATDYGLNFSTSRLMGQDANNRRSSTLTREPPPDQNPASSGSASGESQERVAAAPPPATATSRRKQRAPVSRAHRMNREIRRLRARTSPLIPRLPFSQLVRELILKISGERGPQRITEGALQVLQESTELYLTQRFEDAYLLTHHRGRVTLEVRDMVLMAYLIDVSHHRS
uniref:Id3 n=1 Tax=Drosophila rufa TaxID=67533 RepID=A0A1V0HRV0_9MUSC|nr:Cid3 [Drosophila rufa]ARC76803.1 Cid3 [Drosophila rufa]ARC76850.1 id3 [Drosophila rufa]